MLAIQNCFNKPNTSSLLAAAALGVIITSIAILALTASLSSTSTIASALVVGTSLGLTAVAIASLIHRVKREKITPETGPAHQICKITNLQDNKCFNTLALTPEQVARLSWEQVKEKETSFINAHLKHFKPEQISWLRNEQLPGLDVAALSDEQLNVLLSTGDFFAELTSKQRFDCFSVEQVHVLVPRLNDAQLTLFDDELLKKMDPHLFSVAQLKVLFIDKSRFARVITEDVQGEFHLKLAQAGYQKNS